MKSFNDEQDKLAEQTKLDLKTPKAEKKSIVKDALTVMLMIIVAVAVTTFAVNHIPKRFSQEHLRSLGLIK